MRDVDNCILNSKLKKSEGYMCVKEWFDSDAELSDMCSGESNGFVALKDMYILSDETLLDIAVELVGGDLTEYDSDTNCEGMVASMVLPILADALSMQISPAGEFCFNPNGTITRAEFIYMLDRCTNIIESKECKPSLDRVCNGTEYFSRGYSKLVDTYSSHLFGLYNRGELIKPIKRAEVAYIIVLCWSYYIENIRDRCYDIGESTKQGYIAEWCNPYTYSPLYSDIDGVVFSSEYYSTVCISSEEDTTQVLSTKLQDYKHGKSMECFLDGVRDGEIEFPVPLFMPLVELDMLELLPKCGCELEPLRDISRGELCDLIMRILNLGSC